MFSNHFLSDVSFSGVSLSPSSTPLIILRLPATTIKSELLYRECVGLAKHTRYKKYSKLEDAPLITDCLTAVGYIYKKIANVDIPLDWIGNMPRHLVKRWGWTLLRLDKHELQAGDLLFLGNRRSERLVTHVAVALTVDEIFHSSWQAKGGRIENIVDLLSRYIQSPTVDMLISYVDPRAAESKEQKTTQVALSATPTVKVISCVML